MSEDLQPVPAPVLGELASIAEETDVYVDGNAVRISLDDDVGLEDVFDVEDRLREMHGIRFDTGGGYRPPFGTVRDWFLDWSLREGEA